MSQPVANTPDQSRIVPFERTVMSLIQQMAYLIGGSDAQQDSARATLTAVFYARSQHFRGCLTKLILHNTEVRQLD